MASKATPTPARSSSTGISPAGSRAYPISGRCTSSRPSSLHPFPAGFQVAAGDLGENITTAGLDLERMPLGTLIELGPMAIVELTGLRTPCVLIDRFRAGLKQQVLSSAETGPPFKSGVLGVVRAGGMVAAGDTARIRLPSSSFRPLPAV